MKEKATWFRLLVGIIKARNRLGTRRGTEPGFEPVRVCSRRRKSRSHPDHPASTSVLGLATSALLTSFRKTKSKKKANRTFFSFFISIHGISIRGTMQVKHAQRVRR